MVTNATGSGGRRRRALPLAALRGFESAARHLSFTIAADELSLTQSSISRQIAALERQLGKPLFDRHTRALTLTPAGERLYAATQQALLAIDRSVDEIRGDEALPRVTVSTYASFASLWLVPRLSDFQRKFPGVDIRIDASDRMVDLEADGVDVVVRWLRPGASVPNDAPVLMDEDMAPAMSPQLLAEARSRGLKLEHPSELAQLPLLMMDETVPSALFTSWAKWCEFAGIAPFARGSGLYFTFTDQCVQAAVRGQGVAMVRNPFLDDHVASGDLVLPFPKLRMRTGYRYFLLVNRQRIGSPHVAGFAAWVEDEFKRGPRRQTWPVIRQSVDRGIRDDDIERAVVDVRLYGRNARGIEGDADRNRPRLARRERSVVEAGPVAEPVPLAIEPDARNEQPLGLDHSTMRRNGDSEVGDPHRSV